MSLTLALIASLACGGAEPEPAAVPTPTAQADLHGEAAGQSEAPVFSLKAMNGEERTPAALKGHPTVIWFYPKAGTPGCTIEGCGYRDLHDEFETYGVGIVGMSFDPPEANAAWAAQQKFPFELWSDSERTLAMHYGAATTADATHAARITVLLDADGRWIRTYKGVNDDIGAHPQRVLADVQQLFNDEPAG